MIYFHANHFPHSTYTYNSNKASYLLILAISNNTSTIVLQVLRDSEVQVLEFN